MNIRQTLCVLASVTLLAACNGSTPDVGSEQDQQTQTLEKFNVSVSLKDVEIVEQHSLELNPVIAKDERIQGYSWKQLGDNPTVKLILENTDQLNVKISAPEIDFLTAVPVQLQLTVKGPRNSEVKKKVNVVVHPIYQISVKVNEDTITYVDLKNQKTYAPSDINPDETKWHIAFRGNNIIMNGGTSGSGQVKGELIPNSAQRPKNSFLNIDQDTINQLEMKEDRYLPALRMDQLLLGDWWMLYGNTNHIVAPDIDNNGVRITNYTATQLSQDIGVHIGDLSGQDLGEFPQAVTPLFSQKTELIPNLTLFRIKSLNEAEQTLSIESKSQIFSPDPGYIEQLKGIFHGHLTFFSQYDHVSNQRLPFSQIESKPFNIKLPTRGNKLCYSLAYQIEVDCETDRSVSAQDRLSVDINGQQGLNSTQEKEYLLPLLEEGRYPFLHGYGWDFVISNEEGNYQIWLNSGGSYLAYQYQKISTEPEIGKFFPWGAPHGNGTVRVLGPIQDEALSEYDAGLTNKEIFIQNKASKEDNFFIKMTSDKSGYLDKYAVQAFNTYLFKDENNLYKLQITHIDKKSNISFRYSKAGASL
ncbi:HmuY family protein [Algicola sagamiensis]|uniref:HmuY family protein n=1 Tax=Algicola sagamiensis TaxID=163869 RepID=UPI000361853C|nr:HmuY family protein [Algicola sagamiensis]